MPHRVFSATQLRAMRAEEEVVFQTNLPSLARRARTASWSGSRTRRWRGSSSAGPGPVNTNVPAARAAPGAGYPICRAVPRLELVFICTAHHHVCFTCLLAILRSAHQSSAELACPMRCGALYIHDALPAFRHMLDALDTPHTL